MKDGNARKLYFCLVHHITLDLPIGAMDSAIVTRYQRYKAGTRKTVQYLFGLASKCRETSARCRELSNTLSCFKLGKHANTAASVQKPLRISTPDLLRLAQTIAAAEPPAEIANQFWTVLTDVIELRKQCSSWYASQAMDDKSKLAKDNHTHEYFIGVLQRIYDILSFLRPHSSPVPAPVTASKPKKKCKKTAPLAELENLFECLDLEEPHPEPLGSQAAQHAVPVQRAAHIALEDDDDDECMALWSFLSDMNDIRAYVRDLWVQHREGRISLANAGYISEIALGIVKRSFKDFADAHPNLSTWPKISTFLRLMTCINNNVLYLSSRDTGARAKQAASSTQPTDLLCTPAHHLLQAFLEARYHYLEAARQAKTNYYYGDLPTIMSLRPHMAFEAVLMSMVCGKDVIKLKDVPRPVSPRIISKLC